ncbi:MAG: enoyl-CoA hydratase-related protein [Chloroflexota bacterium]
MDFETILYTIENGVATITLNRPKKLNAFNDQMAHETTKALKGSARNPEVRAIMITGSGRGFSAGADLSSGDLKAENLATRRVGDHLKKVFHPIVIEMVSIEKPVITAVNGVAAGVGMSVALSGDIRIAGDKSAFTLGFSKIGLVPDGGANWLLTRMLGYAKAFEIAVTSEKISAEKALELGLLNHVILQDELMPFATAMAEKIAAGPTRAFGLTKRAMQASLNQSYFENLEYEAHLQTIAGRTEDHLEGVTAFLEKRPSEFKGK